MEWDKNKIIILDNIKIILKKLGKNKTWLNSQIFGTYLSGKPKGSLWRTNQKTLNMERAHRAAEILKTSVDDLMAKPLTETYIQIPEHMGVPKSNLSPDSDRGSYGLPDLDGYEPKELFIPEEIDPFAAAVSGLKEIFESRDPIVVSAIQANVRAFQLSVRRERKIGQQSKEIDMLKDKCDEFEEKLADIDRKLEKSLSSNPEEGNINKKAI